MGRRGTGGSAGDAGYDFQARAIAYVAAHVLSRTPLEWTARCAPDVPVAIEAEMDRSGDDIQIELDGTPWQYSAQAKLRLRTPSELPDALAGFVTDLEVESTECGMLAVGPDTHPDIARKFREDLDRLRDGRRGPLSKPTKTFLASLDTQGRTGLHERIYVIGLQLEPDYADARKAALQLLRHLLGGDHKTASQVWDTLVDAGHELIRKRGRMTRESLESRLLRRGYHIRATAGGVSDDVGAEMLRRIAAVHDLVASRGVSAPAAPAPEAAAATDARSAAWEAQLALARELLEGQQPAAALHALERLDTVLSGATPAPGAALRRRVRANIGVAYVRLGRMGDAAAAFEAALAFEAEDPTTLTNLARVEYLLDRETAAVDHAHQALRVAPDNEDAWALLVELGAEPRTAVPAAVAEHPSVLTAAALRLMREARDATGPLTGRPAAEVRPGVADQAEGQAAAEFATTESGAAEQASVEQTAAEALAEAVALLRRAVELRPGEPEELFLLAHALVQAPRGPFARSGATDAALTEADTLATQAIEALGEGAGFSILHEQLLLFRATVRRALERDADALVDAERALRLHPTDAPEGWRPVVLCAGLMIDRDEPTRALGILDGPLAEAHAAGVYLMRARAYVALHRQGEVRHVLERALALDPGEDAEPQLAAVEVALAADLPDLAEQILARLSRDEVGWVYDLFRARLALARESVDDAIGHFKAAIAAAEPEHAPRVRYELAMVLGRHEDFAGAVHQFEVADVWTWLPSARPAYVHALLKLGRLDAVAARLAELEAAGPLPEWAARTAVSLADQRDDVPAQVR